MVISCSDSFSSVQDLQTYVDWVLRVKNVNLLELVGTCFCMIVANKSDLPRNRVVPKEDGKLSTLGHAFSLAACRTGLCLSSGASVL